MDVKSLKVTVPSAIFAVSVALSGGAMYAQLDAAVASNAAKVVENKQEIETIQQLVILTQKTAEINQAILIRIERRLSAAEKPH